MKKLVLFLTAMTLVGCQADVETKEYSCAPQNISFQFGTLTCVRAGPVSNHPEPIKIYCREGTYNESDGSYSCVDADNVRHVITAIIISDEEAFKRKTECQKYLPQIEQKLAREENDLILPGRTSHMALERIFYSLSMNSCLYVSTETEFYDTGEKFITFVVSDALSGERLMNTSGVWKPADQKEEAEFQRFLKEYE